MSGSQAVAYNTGHVGDNIHIQQVLKCMAHVCRMVNDAPQKQLLFYQRSSNRTWKYVENTLDIDQRQAKCLMMNTKDILQLLELRFEIELKQLLPQD